MIVDCGYLHEQKARDRADQIFALGVSRRNLIFGPSSGRGMARLHIRIPKLKQAAVTKALRISDKKTWFGATHSLLGDAKSNTTHRRAK